MQPVDMAVLLVRKFAFEFALLVDRSRRVVQPGFGVSALFELVVVEGHNQRAFPEETIHGLERSL